MPEPLSEGIHGEGGSGLRYVDAATKVAAIAALALPFVGAVTRLVMFSPVRGIPPAVALAASPGDLALTGLPTVIYWLPFAVLLLAFNIWIGRDLRLSNEQASRGQALLARIEPVLERVKSGESGPDIEAEIADLTATRDALEAERLATDSSILRKALATLEATLSWIRRRPGAERLARIPALSRIVMLTVYALGGLVLCLVAPLASAVILLVGQLMANMIASSLMQSRGSVSTPRLALVVLIVVLTAAISVGLYPRSARPEFVQVSSPSTTIPSGWYGELGRTDQMVYLMPCDPPAAPLVALRADLITSISYGPEPTQYPSGILARDSFTVGFVSGCSHP